MSRCLREVYGMTACTDRCLDPLDCSHRPIPRGVFISAPTGDRWQGMLDECPTTYFVSSEAPKEWGWLGIMDARCYGCRPSLIEVTHG